MTMMLERIDYCSMPELALLFLLLALDVIVNLPPMLY